MARTPNPDSDRNAADNMPGDGNVADFYFFQDTGEAGLAASEATDSKSSRRDVNGEGGSDVVIGSDGRVRSEPLELGGVGGLTDGDDPTGAKAPPQLVPFLGTQFNDVLYAYGENMPELWSGSISGLGGDDVIFRDRTGSYQAFGGSFGDAWIYGGQGHDIVSYSGLVSSIAVDLNLAWAKQYSMPGANQFGFDHLSSIEGIVGTTHNDSMVGNASANDFWGHDGHDGIDGGDGNDRIWGGVGNDTLIGGGGNDTIEGNTGHDVISGGSGDDLIGGGSGNDTISGGSNNDTIYGGSGNDEIEGGSGNDTIYDGDGSDDIKGGHGHDTIYLSDGNDTAYGHTGNDVFHVSGFGDNVINGAFNNDTVVYGNSAVTALLYLGSVTRADGTDTLTSIENVETGNGVDYVGGNSYANKISTGGGNDVLFGLGGNDQLNGGAGDDKIWGDQDDDLIHGDGDNDVLHGNEGNDVIYGDSGNDTIVGGTGDNHLFGGSGADVFSWDNFGVGYDHIHDFDIDEDMFSFAEGFFAGGPGPVNLSYALMAVPGFGDHTVLWANTATDGWHAIARLDGVSASELQQRIDNGTILDVEATGLGGGAPGGFDFDQPFNPFHDAETGTDFFL